LAACHPVSALAPAPPMRHRFRLRGDVCRSDYAQAGHSNCTSRISMLMVTSDIRTMDVTLTRVPHPPTAHVHTRPHTRRRRNPSRSQRAKTAVVMMTTTAFQTRKRTMMNLHLKTLKMRPTCPNHNHHNHNHNRHLDRINVNANTCLLLLRPSPSSTSLLPQQRNVHRRALHCHQTGVFYHRLVTLTLATASLIHPRRCFVTPGCRSARRVRLLPLPRRRQQTWRVLPLQERQVLRMHGGMHQCRNRENDHVHARQNRDLNVRSCQSSPAILTLVLRSALHLPTRCCSALPRESTLPPQSALSFTIPTSTNTRWTTTCDWVTSPTTRSCTDQVWMVPRAV
jgi:hypothetical protein